MRRVSGDIVAARGIGAVASTAVRAVSTSRPVSRILQKLVNKPDPATLPVGDQLRPFEQKIFSQHGEDGVLKELCFRIGLRHGYFVEFGVQDGTECNTAVFARIYGWGGLYIEGGSDYYAALEKLYRPYPNVRTAHAFLTTDNIATILEHNDVPNEFDVLSIDVDGNDFWLWRALGSYRPKLIVVEYNGAYVPPKRWIMKYQADYMWDGSSYFGASLASMSDLAAELGYALLGTDSTGVNAFFVRRDLLDLTGFRELTPEEAYRRPHYGMLGIPYPYRNGPACEDDAAKLAARGAN